MTLLFKRAARAALAATLGLAAAAAHAITGTVTVHWQTLNVQIQDTNPTDGISPTLVWESQSTQSGAFRGGWLGVNSLQSDWTISGGITFADALLTLHTEFDADRLTVSAASSGGDWSATRIYRYGAFSLTGDGRVTFSVDMEAHVGATAAELAWHGGTYGGVWPYADANLLLEGPGGSMALAHERADLDAWGLDHFATMQISADLSAGTSYSLQSQPGVVLNPVPEPATLVLWPVGLASLAWLLRRRSMPPEPREHLGAVR